VKVNGTDNIGKMMTHQCSLAQTLATRIDDSTALERMAPVALNIVCFRYLYAGDDDIDTLKKASIQSWYVLD
jgi:glutamate/tyrosine decarboxylase-like PLP-dependent enzyme